MENNSRNNNKKWFGDTFFQSDSGGKMSINTSELVAASAFWRAPDALQIPANGSCLSHPRDSIFEKKLRRVLSFAEFARLSGRQNGVTLTPFWFFCGEAKEPPAAQATKEIQSQRWRSRRKKEEAKQRSCFNQASEIGIVSEIGSGNTVSHCKNKNCD